MSYDSKYRKGCTYSFDFIGIQCLQYVLQGNLWGTAMTWTSLPMTITHQTTNVHFSPEVDGGIKIRQASARVKHVWPQLNQDILVGLKTLVKAPWKATIWWFVERDKGNRTFKWWKTGQMLFLVFSVSSHYVMIFTRCVLLVYMVFADTSQNARYVHSVH